MYYKQNRMQTLFIHQEFSWNYEIENRFEKKKSSIPLFVREFCSIHLRISLWRLPPTCIITDRLLCVFKCYASQGKHMKKFASQMVHGTNLNSNICFMVHVFRMLFFRCFFEYSTRISTVISNTFIDTWVSKRYFPNNFVWFFFWKNLLLRCSFCVHKLCELFDVQNVQLLEQTNGHTQTISDKILTVLVYATRLFFYRKCANSFSPLYIPHGRSLDGIVCSILKIISVHIGTFHKNCADYYALNELNLSSCESKSKNKPKSNTQIQFQMGFSGGSKFMKRN